MNWKPETWTGRPPATRSVIAVHLIHTLYGHWAVNDPRGSGSRGFYDLKFVSLGPLCQGRKPDYLQPSVDELRRFHCEHEQLLKYPLIWVDQPLRREIADAMAQVIAARGYTCYAGAICSNHTHLMIRTHRDKGPAIWCYFRDAIRDRLRQQTAPHIDRLHPVISARPWHGFLYTPQEVRVRSNYIRQNPQREGLTPQPWDFVQPYDGWPLHRRFGR